MKIICKILLCLLIFGFGEKCDMVANAKVEKTTYAKALTGCVLYKTTSFDSDVDNIFFIVPETYFVVVLDEISNICLKVQYDKFVGYVDSRKVVIATFSPIVKTLDDVTCDVKETSGTQIWNKPSTEGDVLTTISANTKSITYIASVYGTIPSGGECNLWYYISYTPSFNSTNVYEGYVYSENITNLSDIVANIETNPENINDENILDDSIYISPSMKTILVVVIATPIILLILIILYKFVKNIRKNTNQEYFEKNKIQDFDEIKGYYENQKQTSLKSHINKMRGVSFTKKLNKQTNEFDGSFPKFPAYDSEDDLL